MAMLKQLILAEKPSQAQDIARGLSNNFSRKDGYLEESKFIITWAFGHLCELQEPECYDEKHKKWSIENLPIIPDQFKYKITKEGSKQFKIIKSLLQRQDVERVISATDPAREGELIARLILMLAGNRKPVYRFWTSNALTPDAVRGAMSNLKPIKEFDRLYQSALARQQADWLIGINGTRALSVKLGELFSVGRVQTSVLKLICDRDSEIEKFKPQDYWNLAAKFKTQGGQYDGLWINLEKGSENKANEDPDGDTEQIASPSAITKEDVARQIQREITGKAGQVRSVKEQIKTEKHPMLFSLTTLQQEANKLFGFSAVKTLQIAQSLYEKHHALSYPRTESQHLNEEIEGECKKILQKLCKFSVKFSLDRCSVSVKNKRVFDSSKLTDHHALIPTGVVPQALNQDELKVYELVVRRFIAAFYPDFKYKHTDVLTIVGRHHFKTIGKTVLNFGWKEIYGNKDKDLILPELREGEVVKAVDAEIIKKQTTPPARYTDASILQVMTNAHKFVTNEKLKKTLKENAGIGTPATRAGILETLQDRKYIQRKGKTLAPTNKGMFLIDILKDERVASVAYTALWEQELEKIASGEVNNLDAFMEGIKKYTKEFVDKLKKGGKMTEGYDSQSNGKSSIGKCPECGAGVYNGQKSYFCSNWRAQGCKFSLWKNSLERLGKKSITENQAKELLAGKEITLKGLKSKAGKEFDAKGKISKSDKWGWGVELVFGGN